MKLNKKGELGIMLYIFLFALIVFGIIFAWDKIAGVWSDIKPIRVDGKEGMKYECNIVLEEGFSAFGSKPEIAGVDCFKKSERCGLLFSLFEPQNAIVEVHDSRGKLASRYIEGDFWSRFSGRAEGRIAFCTADNDVDFKVYDNDHKLIETENFYLR